MKRLVLSLVVLLWSIAAAHAAVYYINSTTGVDGAGCGTLASPCSTPNGVASNETVNCGDIIVAETGYAASANMVISGTVNCSGQNNVAWVRCQTAFSCTVNNQLLVEASYWGVQGFNCQNVNICIVAEPASAANITHIALANNLSAISQFYAYGTDDNGHSGNGVDYLMIVGNIGWESAEVTTVCGAGVSVDIPIGSGNIYTAWNYLWGNGITGTGCNSGGDSDRAGVKYDTWPNYTGKGILENNLLVENGGMGFEMTNGANASGSFLMRNNTAASNFQWSHYSQICCYAEIAIGLDLANVYAATEEYNITAGTHAKFSSYNAPQGSFFQTNGGVSFWDNNFEYQSSSGFTTGYATASGQTTNCVSGTIGPQTSVSTSVRCADETTGTSPAFVNPASPNSPGNCTGFTTTAACAAALIANFTPTQATAKTMGFLIPAANDANNDSQFNLNVYHALPYGLVPYRG